MTDRPILDALAEVIEARKRAPASQPSYVANLLKGGIEKIGQKIIEEAAEVVEAGAEPGEEGERHLTREVADLVFHTFVLLGWREVPWSAVEAELARRFGTSGLVEKASRGEAGTT